MIIQATPDQTRTRLLPIVTIQSGELALVEPYRGPRSPKFVPLAVRVAHKPRHGVSRKTSFTRWAHSRLRELGEALVGSFLILAD